MGDASRARRGASVRLNQMQLIWCEPSHAGLAIAWRCWQGRDYSIPSVRSCRAQAGSPSMARTTAARPKCAATSAKVGAAGAGGEGAREGGACAVFSRWYRWRSEGRAHCAADAPDDECRKSILLLIKLFLNKDPAEPMDKSEERFQSRHAKAGLRRRYVTAPRAHL